MTKRYEPKDRYFWEAKKKGLRARSAFKIEEIAHRFRLLRSGLKVLDLGAAPGGFLQILAQAVGPKGLVVGVDIVPFAPLGPNVKVGVVDALAADFLDRLRAIYAGPYDLVTSDMAPKTIGIKDADEARSLELCRAALKAADALLKPGGGFVCKVFMGGDFPHFRDEVRALFSEVKVAKPEASRPGSFEVYLVALGRK